MKTKLLIILCLAIAFTFASCDNANRVDASNEAPRERADSVEKDHVEVENKRGTVYTCTMHPEVIKELPGICPECKMTLVQATN